MPIWCLEKSKAQAFLKMLRSGQISPAQLAAMKTSEERRAFFAKHFGEENAKSMNLALEKKLILKNQQQGLVTWAKQVAGLKPAARRDLLSRVERMDKVLDPKDGAFYEDLAGHVLGTTVTLIESTRITNLASTAIKSKATMEAGKRRGPNDKPTDTEMAYGRARVAFQNYVEDLKTDAKKQTLKEVAVGALRRPVVAAADTLKVVGGTAKSISSSIDNSFIGRQGIQMFLKGLSEAVAFPVTRRGPKSLAIWGQTFNRSFKALWDTFGGKPVMDELRAEIVSDPQYDQLIRAGVAIGTVEEEFPVTWPERIPYIGLGFKASDNAFTSAAYYMRYRAGKALLDIAEKTGVDLNNKDELESIGKIVNSLTARGHLGGKSQKPGIINALLWSPRMLKAQFDILTAHRTDRKLTPFARKQAALNLLQITSGTAMVLAIASLVDPDSVEWDPRSADFGKIKIGNTRFTVNPIATLVTLAARIVSWSTKSSTTGKVTKLGGKFGERSGLDVIYNFIENKTAPAAGIVVNVLKDRSRQTGRPPTIKTEATGAFTPLSIRNIFELSDDKKNADSRMTGSLLLLGSLADAIGISTNTYSKFQGLTREDVNFEIGQAKTRKDAMKKLATRAWNREALTPEYREQVAKWKEFPDLKKALDAKLGTAAYGLTEKRRKDQTEEEYKEAQGVRLRRLKQAGVDLPEAQRLLKATMRARRIVKATARLQRIQKLKSTWGAK